MNLNFVDRIIKTSIVLSLLAFPFLAIYIKTSFAVAYLMGCLWGCLNILAIRLLITQVISPDPKNKILIILFIFVKFPVIYFLGYLLIIWPYTSIYGLLWGFSSIFIVTLLKVISRQILHLDARPWVKTP